MIYKLKHYKPHEFVSNYVYNSLTSRGLNPLLVMDERMLITADQIREYFGKSCTINNWLFGGNRHQSGFRDKDTDQGAEYSQHRFGRALDILIDGVPAEEARQAIMANQCNFPHITAMEDNVSWLHVDCRIPSWDGIKLFKM